ncbi:MAG: Stk1 family PASTA domain-containing Ser/Thr kinase [Oscillospiraceae bacterium]|jgi:serine/threonine-protein kinase|nr:Stk1 family PASTA domain-containing Ser/Thr kinase [Oscillospiraceae bacterium]
MEEKYIGTVLDGRYEILNLIGKGGMSMVFRARCHKLNRFVAVKILNDDLSEKEEFRRRFVHECEAIASITHPNIVTVFDVQLNGPVYYIVMELVQGVTLKAYINKKGALPWKAALHFSLQIAGAIEAAHSAGIIHRDIKSQNIMVLHNGQIKVADFGIARLTSKSRTLTNTSFGSVEYISPEMAKGSATDKRTDIYSFGVVIYEMLTGVLPFEAETPVAIALAHINREAIPMNELNPDIPLGFCDIVAHAMQKSPVNRYHTAEKMIDDLEEFRINPNERFIYSLISEEPVGKTAVVDTDIIRRTAAEEAPEDTPEIPGEPVRKKKSPIERVFDERAAPTKKEARQGRRKASYISTLVTIVGVGVPLVILFVIMWVNVLGPLLNPKQVERVPVDNFVGMAYNDLMMDNDILQKYVFTAVYESSETAPEGEIISQSPLAEALAPLIPDQRIPVTLTVSTGIAPPVLMPELTGREYHEAKNILDRFDLNLKYEFSAVPDDNISKDFVVETIPKPGDAIIKGMTIVVKYSDGPLIVLVKVPDVVGLQLSAAILQLQSYDLQFETIYVPDDRPRDQVIFATQVGQEVEKGTVIRLQVSEGPKETPTPEPTPTPSEEPEYVVG